MSRQALRVSRSGNDPAHHLPAYSPLLKGGTKLEGGATLHGRHQLWPVLLLLALALLIVGGFLLDLGYGNTAVASIVAAVILAIVSGYVAEQEK